MNPARSALGLSVPAPRELPTPVTVCPRRAINCTWWRPQRRDRPSGPRHSCHRYARTTSKGPLAWGSCSVARAGRCGDYTIPQPCVCRCRCVHAYMCVCVCTCTCIHVRVCVYMHIYVCVCMLLNTCTCVCVCVYMNTCVCECVGLEGGWGGVEMGGGADLQALK